tara:strand:- start:4714 stop:4908 length:195 start_codon:yes stop_codon:yes gene_type:complete
MLPDTDIISKSVNKFLTETGIGVVDMELVEYICTLKDSEISTDEFRSCLIELFKEYNKRYYDEN